MTPLQSQESLDITFDDCGTFDLDTEVAKFADMHDSIALDPAQIYASFDFR
jgi:aldehyde dehydrogenase (NAD+)